MFLERDAQVEVDPWFRFMSLLPPLSRVPETNKTHNLPSQPGSLPFSPGSTAKAPNPSFGPIRSAPTDASQGSRSPSL